MTVTSINPSTMLQGRPQKTIDFGYGGTAASLSYSGRFLSLHCPHPTQGMLVVAPYEQFPTDQFHDPEFVRAYRAKPLLLVDQPNSGFGLSLKIDGIGLPDSEKQNPGWGYLHSSFPTHSYASGSEEAGMKDVTFDSLYASLPIHSSKHPTANSSSTIIQRLVCRNKSEENSHTITLEFGGMLSINRAAYAQLTEGGPIPMPEAENILSVSHEEGLLSVVNKFLPARLDAGLFIEHERISMQQPSTSGAKSEKNICSYSTTHDVTLAPQESVTFTLVLQLSTSVSSGDLAAGSFPSIKSLEESLDKTVQIIGAGISMSSLASMLSKSSPERKLQGTPDVGRTVGQVLAFSVLRNIDYLLGCCMVPIPSANDDGGKGTCVITDHQCLPLGWNRDNYYQMQALTSLLPHLPSLVSARVLSSWQSTIHNALRSHLIWVYKTAQRPEGFWTRSYVVTGKAKDSVFQLDQQCYPFLEVCDYAELYAISSGSQREQERAKEERTFLRELLKDVVKEVIDFIRSKQWTPKEQCCTSDLGHDMKYEKDAPSEEIMESRRSSIASLSSSTSSLGAPSSSTSISSSLVLNATEAEEDSKRDLWLFKTDETPGDDAVIYPYHFSSHVLLWRTFSRLSWLKDVLSQDGEEEDDLPFIDAPLEMWAEFVRRDTISQFTVSHSPISVTGTGEFSQKPLFAYLTSTTGQYEFYHDANDLPTALASTWGFCDKADPTWLNTMNWAFSTLNSEGYFDKGKYSGLGSVHTKYPWPLGDAQELLFSKVIKDKAREERVKEKLCEKVQWDGLFSEAVDGERGFVTSKHWFGWPGCFIASTLLSDL